MPSDDNVWPTLGDPRQQVGSRHHTVPRFYLASWSNEKDMVSVIQKPDGHKYKTNPKHASTETDFYSYVDQDGNLSGYLEQLLGTLEKRASQALSCITHKIFGRFPPTLDDKHVIATFLAVQKVRGKKTRKSIELQTDFLTKLQYTQLDSEGIEHTIKYRTGKTRRKWLLNLKS